VTIGTFGGASKIGEFDEGDTLRIIELWRLIGKVVKKVSKLICGVKILKLGIDNEPNDGMLTTGRVSEPGDGMGLGVL
jgi:hypothetical protein